MKRALSYKNLIDPETKYMRGRDSQGELAFAIFSDSLSGPRVCKWLGGYYRRVYFTVHLVCAS